MPTESVNELLKKYKETGDERYRNQFAEQHFYIAEILAKKLVGRGVPYDDLYQEAVLSLLRGIDRFDPEKGLQFSTFITPTIMGELKNYFRDKLRLVKPPRRLSEINLSAKKYAEKRFAETGEKPTVAEIAQALKVEEEELVRALEIGNTISLDTSKDSEGDEGQAMKEWLPSEDTSFSSFETRETLKQEMEKLTEMERLILKYRFEDELSQQETAMRLGVSQMFVSRRERTALAKLKQQLAGQGEI